MPAEKREISDQSQSSHPILPPKRIRRKSGLPVTPVPRSSKKPGELLTADEKKANHIASEQKRRQAIREGFDKITAIVPDLKQSQGRSEATVLTETVKLLHKLIDENQALMDLANASNLQIPDAIAQKQQQQHQQLGKSSASPGSSASPEKTTF